MKTKLRANVLCLVVGGAVAVGVGCTKGDAEMTEAVSAEGGASDDGGEDMGSMDALEPVPELDQPAADMDYDMPATPPTGGGEATTETRYVNAAEANVRESASTSARVIGKLKRGEAVEVTIEGKWARMTDGGYVAASLLTSNLKPARSAAKPAKKGKAKKAVKGKKANR